VPKGENTGVIKSYTRLGETGCRVPPMGAGGMNTIAVFSY